MRHPIFAILLATVFFCVVPVLQVTAADAGDPVFPMDTRDKARGGVVYERINRSLDVTSGRDASSTIKADALYFRINTDVGQMATMDFDIGAVDPKGGDYTYYIGAGLRMLAFDIDPSRLSIFAQIHYAPIETKRDGQKTKYDYVEAECGVLFSLKVPIEDQVTLMPYVGPVLSFVRLNGNYSGDDVNTRFDAEEKNILGGAAGLSLKMKEHHSIRAELRYFENMSYSIAVSIAF